MKKQVVKKLVAKKSAAKKLTGAQLKSVVRKIILTGKLPDGERTLKIVMSKSKSATTHWKNITRVGKCTDKQREAAFKSLKWLMAKTNEVIIEWLVSEYAVEKDLAVKVVKSHK